MKIKCLATVFVLVIAVFQETLGQDSIKAMITGTWYSSDNTPLQFADSVVLQKDFTGDKFNMWEFNASNTLKISSGSIRGNNKNAKCFNKVLHYSWQLQTSEDDLTVVQISYGKNILRFTIQAFHRSKIILVRV